MYESLSVFSMAFVCVNWLWLVRCFTSFFLDFSFLRYCPLSVCVRTRNVRETTTFSNTQRNRRKLNLDLIVSQPNDIRLLQMFLVSFLLIYHVIYNILKRTNASRLFRWRNQTMRYVQHIVGYRKEIFFFLKE